MVRGPTMAEVTAGWRVTNAMAICTSVIPASSASAPSASAAANFPAFAGSVASRAAAKRVARMGDPDPAISRPLRYLPVSQPPARGLQVMTPMP